MNFFLGVVETYGIAALNLEKGNYFLPAFSFFLFSALAALFSPLVYAKNKYAYYFLAALLIIAAFLALFIGSAGIYGHLASPP
ncbi:MAG: DUF981 family protein [Candidatus Micrarchaeia archaeon]